MPGIPGFGLWKTGMSPQLAASAPWQVRADDVRRQVTRVVVSNGHLSVSLKADSVTSF